MSVSLKIDHLRSAKDNVNKLGSRFSPWRTTAMAQQEVLVRDSEPEAPC